MRQQKVIDILRGSGGAKRASRKAQIDLTVTCGVGVYIIQANGKTLEDGVGDRDYAESRAKARARDITAKTGKTVSITVY
jgi:hypothetical protein